MYRRILKIEGKQMVKRKRNKMGWQLTKLHTKVRSACMKIRSSSLYFCVVIPCLDESGNFRKDDHYKF
jgi:hypothetical protein